MPEIYVGLMSGARLDGIGAVRAEFGALPRLKLKQGACSALF